MKRQVSLIVASPPCVSLEAEADAIGLRRRPAAVPRRYVSMSQDASNVEAPLSYAGITPLIRMVRSSLLTVIVALVGLLGLNTYLLYISSSAVILNVDQARWEQSEMHDSLSTRLIRLELELEALPAPAERAEVVAR